jgi:DNA repair exonuclease SbcCD nuclease subunit
MSYVRVFISDLHVNASTYGGDEDRDGLTFRIRDFMRSTEWATDEIINQIKPQEVWCLGDIYDNPYPASNIRQFFYSQVKRLLDAGIIVHILVGNHDACKLHHGLQPLLGLSLPNLHIYYTPTKFIAPDGTLFLIMPHTEAIERQEVELRDSLLENIAQWRPEVAKAHQEGHKVVLCGHFGVFGAKANDGYANKDQSSVRIEDLESLGADYIYLGDFHVFQILKTNPDVIAMYIGSLERTNFLDLETPKGFVIHSSDELIIYNDLGFPNIRFVENPRVRPMYMVRGTIDQIQERIEAIKDKVKDAVVKIDFTGEEQDYRDFTAIEDQLKDTLEKDGAAKLVRCEKRMVNTAQKLRAAALKNEIENKDEIGWTDICDIVDKSIESAITDPEERESIRKENRDIMQTVDKRMKI